MLFRTPVQTGLIFASIFFIVGIIFKPILCVPLALAGLIIGSFGRLLINKVRQKSKLTIEIIDELNEAVFLFNEYLDTMPIENVEIENQLKQKWNEANALVSKHGYGPGHDTHYDVKDGSKDYVKTDVEQEISTFHQKKNEPEYQGWSSFMAMLKNRSNSCYYRWGVNKLGIEIHRFAPDRYTLIKAWNDRYYR